MESTELKVSSLFQNRLFRVPDYQRGYAWEEQQCRDFVEDLDLIGPGGKHFFGMLILHADDTAQYEVRDEMAQSYEVYDVVDGQQRLTTLVIYLHALHREMEEIPDLERIARRLKETYVATRDPLGQPMFKLTLNQDTDRFFRTAILEQSTTIEGASIRSEELLNAAKDYFTAQLEVKRTALGEGFPAWLRNEYVKVTDQLTVMVYEVDSDSDAGIVFETMNNRGKQLTELEKVKNYLLYVASKLELPADHDLAKDVNDTWTLVFRRLMAAGLTGVEDEDGLLRTNWLMAYDYDTNRWQQYRSVRARFALADYADRHEALLDEIKEYLATLRNAAIAYCDAYRPHGPGAFADWGGYAALPADCHRAADRLSRLGLPAAFLPLLIATRIRYAADVDAYRRMLELAELFTFRVYRLLGRPSNTGRSLLLRLGHKLFQSRRLAEVMGELVDAILYYSPEHDVTERFDAAGMDWFHWAGIKYVLYEYEQQLADQAGQDVRMPWDLLTRKQDTVEHILPQSLPPGGYWRKRFSSQEHESWVHDIGNLTLTYDNSALSNKTFPEKKGDLSRENCYASSMLFTERAIAQHDDWTPSEIRARHHRITEWALRRWHVEPAERLPPPADDVVMAEARTGPGLYSPRADARLPVPVPGRRCRCRSRRPARALGIQRAAVRRRVWRRWSPR